MAGHLYWWSLKTGCVVLWRQFERYDIGSKVLIVVNKTNCM